MTPQQQTEYTRLKVRAAKAIREAAIFLVATDPGAPLKSTGDEYDEWLCTTINDEIADDSSESILTMASTEEYPTTDFGKSIGVECCTAEFETADEAEHHERTGHPRRKRK